MIKSYDPITKTGSVVSDVDLVEYELAADSLEGSIFRMIRQGQRVVFRLDDDGFATEVRFGSERDLGEPLFPGDLPPAASRRPIG